MPRDRLLVVDASDSGRMARIRLRNPDWSTEQIDSVFAMQPSRASYLAIADDVISNDGDLEALHVQAGRLHCTYLKNWS